MNTFRNETGAAAGVTPPVRAVIDLAAYRANLQRLQALAPRSQQMAVVKANAYGHGLGPMALAAVQSGAQWLGVAKVSEAVALRKEMDRAGTAHDHLCPSPTHAVLAGRPYHAEPCPIPTSRRPRIFSWIYGPSTDLETVLKADIDLSVSTPAQLDQVAKAADNVGVRARVHLKVDTGLSRAGCRLENFSVLASLAYAKARSGVIEVSGLWSHLGRADEPTKAGEEFTHAQLNTFEEASTLAWQAGLDPQVRHIAASGGLLWYPESHYDLVRPGIAAYGLSPNPAIAQSADLGLHPVLRLEAEVTQVKRLQAGDSVSYGGIWKAPTDTWIALIPVGYGDGLPRSASNRAPVWVAGRRAKVVGRIAMDQIMVYLGPAADDDGNPLPPPAVEGDLAVLFGDPAQRLAAEKPTASPAAFTVGASRLRHLENNYQPPTTDPGFDMLPSVDEWATAAQTISYEVTTALGADVPRVYQGRLDPHQVAAPSFSDRELRTGLRSELRASLATKGRSEKAHSEEGSAL